jgi:putative ABC transport system permease protein
MSAHRDLERWKSVGDIMKLTAHIHEGLLNLFSAKLRSILALLGILVGTASVVAMVSGGELATNEALKQFKTLGTDLLAVSVNEASDQESSGSNSQSNLTLSQALNLNEVDHSILNVAPYTQVYSPMSFNGHEVSGSILGVTDSFAQVVHVKMLRGRFISLLDGYSFYCVIGHGIYDAIKQYTNADPIGQQIQVGKEFFTIVGIAEVWPENSFVYANIDFSIMVPLLSSTALSKYSSINNIILQLTPNANIDSVKDKISVYINKMVEHKSLFFRSAKELINRMAKQSEILTVFLGLIGGVSLVVGGIGVMNIMLVSVVERRREIGIRLAVGARRKDIRALFLVEAVMLSLVGGVVGVTIGMLIAYIIALFWHWQFTVFLFPPLIGFTVSAATGIFFGFYPAYKASQLDPIEALRSE